MALEGGRVRGEVFRGRSWLAATERAARAAAVLTEMTGVGREKLWRLLVLELVWEVKLAKMGVPEAEGFWTLAFATVNGAESSLEEDSTLLTRGRDRSVEEALLWGRGEKLPGALGWGLAGCIVVDVLGVCYILARQLRSALVSGYFALTIGGHRSRNLFVLTEGCLLLFQGLL